VADISVAALAMVDAEPDRVRRSLADYREFRPRILTPRFSGYEVLEGGQGSGTRVRWTLNPGRWIKRRARVWDISSEEVDDALVERDTNSSAVLTWTVVPAPDGRSAVKLTLEYAATDGLSGSRAHAQGNRERRLYGGMLFELRKRFAEDPNSGKDVTDNSNGAGSVAADEVSEPSGPTDPGR